MEIQDWIESSVRAFFCFTGIIGNFWLGLRSLPKSRSQLRTNDILFINLAVSNLITNCLVDLPDTMANFVNNWFMGKSYCGVIQFSSDLSETSSIFSTMFISMYWHQKLVGSIRRGGAPVQMDKLQLVSTLLGGSWIVSLAFSVPHFFIAEHDGNESLEVCEERFPNLADKRTFDGLYLILANAVPLIGITYASAQIVLTLLQSRKRIKGANPPPAFVDAGASNSGTQAKTSNGMNNVSNPQQGTQKTQVRSNQSSSNQVRAAKSVVAVATIFLICWFTHLVLRIYSSFRVSILAVKLTSFIGASYTCFVPYVYLHGVKKLNCSCC
ncbi:alpha-1A adrenergic receptor-like [Myxocyprinus asiaticus]|uniref:alpha-1A adrenergic receptor-like n=1 Tax=Myxocyprinus asiaticus TaxID=70543 RepID=UPI00222390FE|nr:alpha-1A adrenergic receptor-like [Myxocyprinus asiaticus]